MTFTDNQLDVVAYEVFHSSHGSFLKAFADAWIKADPFNKHILREAWEKLIKKYKLDKEFL